MNRTVKAIKVSNIALPLFIFNDLCDELSRYRHYCHDYRMVKDASTHHYWQSQTYYDSDTIIIDACYADVKQTAEKFCHAADFSSSAVQVEIVSYTLDD